MKPINEKTGFFFIVILVILIACHQGGLGHVRVDAEDDVGESHCLRKEAALLSEGLAVDDAADDGGVVCILH